MQPWLNDLLVPTAQALCPNAQGVLDFTGGEQLWSSIDLRMLDDEDWIARNWQLEREHALHQPARQRICEAAISTGGPILEIAAGPGGGNLSPLLHLEPEIKIIVNDLEFRIVERWQHFLGDRYSNVAFAAFDASMIPLKDNSMGCVSSRGGISNCRGDSNAVLSECARVLRPGGLLVLYEMCLSPRTVASLPQVLREAWVVSPWVYGDWGDLLTRHSLALLSEDVAERTTVSPEESALAYDAAQFGVVLEIEFRAVIAVWQTV
ncbi:MAG: hypothetical protein FD169_1737 [Bacillota bacterium]|nr:MAG: hypothetical protein FD169_1737 [Bacillota bacterium]